ncbi:MAG TPA: hypothetical protein PLV23_04560 [Sedimentibacter sp.]|nr:hypothetical protein [Sedimentibacter sp.]
MNDVYERLANAIILQAVKDYRDSSKRLKKYPNKDTDLFTIQEVEQFFRSDWYSTLTTIDPEILIRKLKEEVL